MKTHQEIANNAMPNHNLSYHIIKLKSSNYKIKIEQAARLKMAHETIPYKFQEQNFPSKC